MSDEIKAARERLRRLDSGEPYYEIYGCVPTMHGHQQRDEKRILDNDLAEHPADSDEPLTEEWLWSVGGDRFNHPCGFWAFSFTGNAAGDTVIVTLAKTAEKGWRWGFGIDTIKFTTDGTRGAWRNVCGILGIRLTEAKGAS